MAAAAVAGWRILGSEESSRSLVVVPPNEAGTGAETVVAPGPPAIAVLAFHNLSGDPEQEYLSDGIAEDLITRLARVRGHAVIARNSAFAYKSRSVDSRQVGAELGARYLVEGSVRRAGGRIRINAQLIDALTGRHVWAQTYDRELGDTLALQDEITRAIVAAVNPEIAAVEIERAVRRAPENLDAWDYFHRGLWHFYKLRPDHNAKARESFERAIELDPRWSRPFSGLAWTHYIDIGAGWTDSIERSAGELVRAARTAIELDPRDPLAHHALGHAHQVSGDRERAIAAFKHAVDPADAGGYACAAVYLGMAAPPEEAIAMIEEVIRLSPEDPAMPSYFQGMGYAHFAAERYGEAVEWAKRALESPWGATSAAIYRLLAASYAHLDRLEEARSAALEAARLRPGFSSSRFRLQYAAADPQFVERYLEGLRKAGLPEE
jgi:TolB-like protein